LPPSHATPQPPQFVESTRTSKQPSPQRVVVGATQVLLHTPLAQT
jgi:hypothetical protein